jgi:hypothetical protein
LPGRSPSDSRTGVPSFPMLRNFDHHEFQVYVCIVNSELEIPVLRTVFTDYGIHECGRDCEDTFLTLTLRFQPGALTTAHRPPD